MSALGMLSRHRAEIRAYEGQFGVPPDGTLAARNLIREANQKYGLTGVFTVDGIVEALDPAKEAVLVDLRSRYGDYAAALANNKFNAFNLYVAANQYIPSLDAVGGTTLDSSASQGGNWSNGVADLMLGGGGNDVLKSHGGDDVLIGEGGNDKLDGGAGNDLLLGGSGQDNLVGGEGNDTLDGGDGHDFLEGGAGNDNLIGGAGDGDILLGGAGDDVLYGGAGLDFVQGGEGNDTYEFKGNWGTDIVYDSDGKGQLVVQGYGVLDGGTRIDGTNQFESADMRVLYTFVSGMGEGVKDLLVQFRTTPGSAEFLPDTITILNFRSSQLGLPLGADAAAPRALSSLSTSPLGAATALNALAPNGDFGLLFSEGTAPTAQRVVQGDFAKLTGGGLYSREGPFSAGWVEGDGYTYRSAGAQPGAADVINGFSSTSDSILGGGGSDALNGNGGDDILEGGDGDDLLLGGLGADTLRGGAGRDIIFGSSIGALATPSEVALAVPPAVPSGATLVAQGFNWTASMAGSAGLNSRLNLEGSGLLFGVNNDVDMTALELNESGIGNVIDAGEGDDIVYAGGGRDVASGGSGNDTLEGLWDADLLSGGDGNDHLWGDGPARQINPDTGVYDMLWSPPELHGADTLDGGAGHDVLVGQGQADYLTGGVGNDSLWGDEPDLNNNPGSVQGQDTLDGGEDDDNLSGGGEGDVLFGGAGNDKIWADDDKPTDLPEALHGNDWLDAGAGNDYAEGGGGADTLFGGTGNDSLWGDAAGAGFNDSIHGADEIDGGEGDDLLIGQGGADLLLGGDGDDNLYGDQPDGEALGSQYAGADTLDGGAGNDVLKGGGENDLLLGGSGSDDLYGDAGDDTLVGGSGADYLNGGAGNDVYVFQAGDSTELGANGESDTIWDSQGANRIVLMGAQSPTVRVNQGGGLQVDVGEDSIVLPTQSVGAMLGIEVGGKLHSLPALIGSGSPQPLRYTYTAAGAALAAPAPLALMGPAAQASPLSAVTEVEINAGGYGKDTLTTSTKGAVLSGGWGDDTLSSSGGATRIEYRLGDGFDRVNQTGPSTTMVPNASGLESRLVLGEGIALEDLQFSVVGTELHITLNTEEAQWFGSPQGVAFEGFNILSQRFFENSTGRYGIAQIELQDGSVHALNSVMAAQGLVLNGTSANNLMEGSPWADRMDGAGGNDTMKGLQGADTYVWGIGAGQDQITEDINQANSADTIELTEDISPDDLRLNRVGSDLLLSLSTSTDRLTVPGHFNNTSVEFIRFRDGTVWNQSEIQARAVPGYGATGFADNLFGSSGPDTIDGLGGNDTIHGDYGDDVLLGNDGNDYLDGGNGNDRLDGGDGNDTLMGTEYDTLLGGAGNDSLRGSGSIMEGGAGDDILFSVWDTNTFRVDPNEGHDLIQGYGTLKSVLEFMPGISPQDVRVARVSSIGPGFVDFRLSIRGNESSVTLKNFISTSGTLNTAVPVGQVKFSNGTIWTTSDLVANMLTPTEGDDKIEGLSGSDDLMLGLGGDDDLRGASGNDTFDGGLGGDSLSGSSGSDLYLFGRGDGNDAIYDSLGSGEVNVLRFKAGIGPSDVRAELAGYDLVLRLNDGGGSVRLNGFYSPSMVPSPGRSAVQQVQFDDGTTWTYEQLAGLVRIGTQLEDLMLGTTGNDALFGWGSNDTLRGLEGDDWLAGGDYSNDRLEGGPGHDTLLGGDGYDFLEGGDGDDLLIGGSGADILLGGAGFDTYVFDLGDLGEDRISDSSESDRWGNRIVFTAGVEPESVRPYRQNGDLMLERDGRAFLRVVDFFIGSANPLATAGPALIEFANGVGWDGPTLREMLLRPTAGSDVLMGDEGDDSLVGLAGNDTLWGYGGNDTLNGGANADWLEGGDGADVYVYQAGDGADWIGASSGLDTLRLGPGIAPSDLSATRSGTSMLLRIGAGADPITLDSQLVASGGAALDAAIERVEFFDGTAWGFSELMALLANGTTGDDLLTGTAQADLLQGLGGHDTLDGGGGNDSLEGGAGNDSLLGGVGHDLLLGGEGADTLNGGGNGYTDTLAGGLGDDVLSYGRVFLFELGDGRDVISQIGSSGLNEVVFGAGIARADVMATRNGNHLLLTVGNAGDRIEVRDFVDGSNDLDLRFFDGTRLFGSALRADLSAISGTSGADQLVGTAKAEKILGLQGNDTLVGLAGYDTLVGGSGDDTYDISDEDGDWIVEEAGGGTDLVRASVSWTLSDHVENLTLSGSQDLEGYGNDEPNFLKGNSGNNLLYGNSGNDTLDGGAGADTLYGDEGNDLYIVDHVADVVVEDFAPEDAGFSGEDTVQSSVSFTLGNWLDHLQLSGSANLSGIGNELPNRLTGNSGANRLDGAAGADTMMGGAGNDTYVVDNASDEIVEASGGGTDTVEASLSWTLGDELEKLTLTGTANLNGTGNALANTLTGNSGANRLDGDVGNDTMVGGAGDDTYVVDSASDVVTEATSGGNDTIESSVTLTLPAAVETLLLKGTANLNGTGNSLNNTLTGNAGNNRLNGGTGNDTMAGGAGDDTYVVNAAGDVLTEYAGEGEDTVESSVSWTLGAHFENLTITGSSARSGTGNSLDNLIKGGSGADTLIGLGGNDTLDGGAGNDSMIGGAGDDIYLVGAARDKVVENANEGNDTVRSSITFTLGNNVENLELLGSTAINGTGNGLNNQLIGNSAANTLNGGDGDDILVGGAGSDSLVGGKGADQYRFGKGDGSDLITENDNTANVKDVVEFGAGIALADVSFKRNGNALEVRVANAPTELLTIKDWYLGSAYVVEEFRFVDSPGTVLTDVQAASLVSAMAAFGGTAQTLDWDINGSSRRHQGLMDGMAVGLGASAMF